jgi:hypothetical protein
MKFCTGRIWRFTLARSTHRDEIVETADAASIMCAGAVIFTGGPIAAQRYFSTRCRPHLESLGAQPWDIAKPEVQAALASNGDSLQEPKKDKG